MDNPISIEIKMILKTKFSEKDFCSTILLTLKYLSPGISHPE